MVEALRQLELLYLFISSVETETKRRSERWRLLLNEEQNVHIKNKSSDVLYLIFKLHPSIVLFYLNITSSIQQYLTNLS